MTKFCKSFFFFFFLSVTSHS